jgi:hypothetical protein
LEADDGGANLDVASECGERDPAEDDDEQNDRANAKDLGARSRLDLAFRDQPHDGSIGCESSATRGLSIAFRRYS